jgi:serine/threonine-protein kinase
MSTPRLLSNRYELGETLGYGGMSEVHHGHDVRLGREVAIKILRADLARDPQFLERFRREAQNAAALNHPAIVAVYDTGEANAEFGPLPYIVMEYVEGRTLRDIVKTEGPMSQKRAMEVMADVCAALDFSHRHGIVHRDVKPANVMITKNGAVKVMDFGIARAMHDGQSSMTQTAAVIGTAQYLSPEQARGESVDARSDVYAAGCVLYELITGEPPFTGDSPVAVAYQHVREDPSPPSSVNPAVAPELDAVVLKALAKGPANRYQSAAEMRSDLVRTLSGQRPAAPMVMSEDERTQVMNSDRRQPQRYEEYDAPDDEDPAAKRRRRTLLAVLAAVFVAGAVLLIIWLSGAFKGGGEDTATVPIPDVLHQTVPQARETLGNKGFKTLETKNVTCTGVQPTDGSPLCGENDINQVVKTDPAAGTPVSTAAKITLYVGVSPGKTPVPDLKGKTTTQADQALKDAKLTLDPNFAEVEVDDTNQAGLVQSQTPTAETQVQEGSSVKITIGKSKQLKQVSNFANKPYSQAKSALEGQGFTTKKVEQASDTVPKDSVITQDPNGGLVPVGSLITLTVSTGPQNTKIEMPSLVGMTFEEAKSKLQSMGWTGQLIKKADRTSQEDENTVTKQSPTAGNQIDRDQDVTVFVSENLFPTGGPTTSTGP